MIAQPGNEPTGNHREAFWTSYAIGMCIYIYTLMHIIWMSGAFEMRTTLNIDEKLLEKASELTGIKEKTTLVKLGLEALIARESARRLAKLGGTEKELKAIPRRRIAEK